jgi:MSHA biogenesis protein MshQ
VGQPFGYVTTPQATITARNAAGGQTVNYTGTLWKLDALGVAPFYAAVAGTLDGVPGVPVVNSTGSGTGTLALNAADTVSFARTTPVAPFNADISLSISIGDTAEDAVAGNGIIDTLTPAVFTSIIFDSGNQIRFGRLVLSNAYGSEVLSLPVPAETQFWKGTGFIRNMADSCTQLAATNVELSGWRKNLNACETSVSLSGRFNTGRGNLKLSAPGANNTGSVDLTMHLTAAGSGSTCPVGTVTGADQTWLQGAWTGAAYDDNPVARGSFGLYRGNKPLIYIREMY